MLRITSLVPRNHASSLIFEPLALRADVSKIGGDDGNRTHDPLLAGQVLSQLSYTPGVLPPRDLRQVTEN